MTEMSEELGSIRITCSEGSSLGTRVSVVCLDSSFFIIAGDTPLTTNLVCDVTAFEAVFILAAGGGDFTLSVIALLLIGWYLGMGSLRFF